MKRVWLLVFLWVVFVLTACGPSQAQTLPDGIYKRDEVTGSGTKDNFSYKWSFDAKSNQMTFKIDDDPCSTRGSGTSGGPWAYQAAQ